MSDIAIHCVDMVDDTLQDRGDLFDVEQHLWDIALRIEWLQIQRDEPSPELADIEKRVRAVISISEKHREGLYARFNRARAAAGWKSRYSQDTEAAKS